MASTKINCHWKFFQLTLNTGSIPVWYLWVHQGIPKHFGQEELQINLQKSSCTVSLNGMQNKKNTMPLDVLLPVKNGWISPVCSWPRLRSMWVCKISPSCSMAEGGGEKGWLPLTQAHVIHPPDFFSFLQAEQVPDCDPEMGRPMCMRTHTHTRTQTGCGILVGFYQHFSAWTLTQTDKGRSPEVTCPNHHGIRPLQSHQLLQFFS